MRTQDRLSDSNASLRARLEGRNPGEAFLSITTGSSIERIDWGDFWRLVDGFVGSLRDATKPRDLVLIMSMTRIEAIACFFAAICAGRRAAFFPPPSRVQDPLYYRRQQAASMDKIAPDRIITFDPVSRALVEEIGFGHAAFEAAPRGPGDARAALQDFIGRIESDTPALFVQHSSGTTGIKKAVAVSAPMLRGQFESYWRGVIEVMTPHPRIASWLPLYHDMGLVAALVLPTLGGCEMAFIDPFYWVESPQSLFNVIERERANLVWMPNFAFRHYVRIARLLRSRDLSSVEAWINCSEPCRAADADTFEARFADMGVRGDSVIGCYAMAETVFGVSQGVVGARKVLYAAEDQAPGEPVRPGEKAILSSGPPIPDLEIALFTNEARAADDQYGEIGIRAPFLFAGYGGMTAEQSGLRPDGFFMTGDLGAIRDGELFVFGRLKETIIVNGKNIFAGDVEALVAGVEGLKAGRIVAFGVENPGTGSEDLIVVAERGPSARDEASIVSDVTRLINAAFLVSPRAVAVVAERWLVKTTSGKISRAENRAKYLDGLHAEQGHAP